MTNEEALLSPPSATEVMAVGHGGVDECFDESGDAVGAAPRVQLAYEPRYQR